MDKILRIIFILLLFSILAMQIMLLFNSKRSLRVSSIEQLVQATDVDTVVLGSILKEDSQISDANKVNEPKKSGSNDSPKNTEQPKKTAKYTVKQDRCISCNLCVINCPVEAIKMEGGVAKIDEELCIGCGICEDGNDSDFTGCPVDAISKK